MTTTPTTPTIVPMISVGAACGDCTVLLVNGDDSHMDPEAAAEVAATVGAIQTDHAGYLIVDASNERGAELFRCALCGWDTMDTPHGLIVVRSR